MKLFEKKDYSISELNAQYNRGLALFGSSFAVMGVILIYLLFQVI